MDSWKASFLRAGVYPERVGVSGGGARGRGQLLVPGNSRASGFERFPVRNWLTKNKLPAWV